jgi:MFS superfamily sulfate permease-like transporter
LPEAVAYAGLAHFAGGERFDGALVGLLGYAVFGGSRFAIVAPTSSTATLAANAVSVAGAASSTP